MATMFFSSPRPVRWRQRATVILYGRAFDVSFLSDEAGAHRDSIAIEETGETGPVESAPRPKREPREVARYGSEGRLWIEIADMICAEDFNGADGSHAEQSPRRQRSVEVL
jgi:hypothetical protein